METKEYLKKFVDKIPSEKFQTEIRKLFPEPPKKDLADKMKELADQMKSSFEKTEREIYILSNKVM